MRTQLAPASRRLALAVRAAARSGQKGWVVFAIGLLALAVWCLSQSGSSDFVYVSPDTGLEQGHAGREQAALAARDVVQVPRAPLIERLPAAVRAPALSLQLGALSVASVRTAQPSQTISALRARRRVPRMNADEPPWS